MPLQSSWVDSLFARLSARYGVAFTRQYEGIDPAVIKADWAEVLDGVGGESIAYAIRNLPVDRPPNAMQFRELCRNAPRNEPTRLALAGEYEPMSEETLQRLREIAARMKENAQKPKGWRSDRAIDEANVKPFVGPFAVVPEDVLPPGMRKGGVVRDFAADLVKAHESGQFVAAERLEAARSILSKNVE